MDWSLLLLVGVALGLAGLLDLSGNDEADGEAGNDENLGTMPQTDDDLLSEPAPQPDTAPDPDPDTDEEPAPVDPLAGTPGDDVLRGEASSQAVNGRAGDDDIALRSNDGDLTILGGQGDDRLQLQFANGPSVTLDGGKGDDFIDARDLTSADIFGGTGADTIRINGHDEPGAAFTIRTDAGPGPDTIIFNGPANASEELAPQTVKGGSGEDQFDIRFDEGLTFDPDNLETADVIQIADFDPDQDTLIVQPSVADDTYTIASARLEPSVADDTTKLIVRYESTEVADKDVVIVINGTGLDWNDLQFAGPDQPAVLQPV